MGWHKFQSICNLFPENGLLIACHHAVTGFNFYSILLICQFRIFILIIEYPAFALGYYHVSIVASSYFVSPALKSTFGEFHDIAFMDNGNRLPAFKQRIFNGGFHQPFTSLLRNRFYTNP